ncbi:MAG: capsule assembly Wzi family protein [Cyclobacteriaceae bacterium]
MPGKISFLSILLLLSFELQSQSLIGVYDHMSDYTRLLEIQGIYSNNPIILQSPQSSIDFEVDSINHPWKDVIATHYSDDGKVITLLNPEIGITYNSTYARNYNNGPLWTGKGLTSYVNAGVELKLGKFSARVYPNFFYAQNLNFELAENGGRNQFAYQFSNNIDWVQRYGNSELTEIHLGQSHIKATFGNFQIKLSTENMWWGPAVFNPILMSNTAPGFLHLDLGTDKPAKTKLGDFEFHSIWGRLKESDYFDNDDENDNRYMVGATFGYRPSFSKALQGLSVGFSRVLYKEWRPDSVNFKDAFLILRNTDPSPNQLPSGRIFNDETDQLAAIYIRWYFMEVGAEIYMEWAKNDFNADFNDFWQEPDHARAVTWGFQKVFNTPKGFWRFGLEHTALGVTRTVQVRQAGSIYYHSIVRQGYTNEGELIGAPIGPGSNSQLIKVDRFTDNGSIQLIIQRIRFNDDYYFQTFQGPNSFANHDVEFNLALKYVRYFNKYTLNVTTTFSDRTNLYYNTNDIVNLQIKGDLLFHINRL